MTERWQEAEDIMTLSFGYKNSAAIWTVQAIHKCGCIHICMYIIIIINNNNNYYYYIHIHTHMHIYIYAYMSYIY
jgi:hypothetical protein